MDTTPILPLSQIEILYSEAGTSYKGRTFTSFLAAELALCSIANQRQGRGGYYKTGFRITWTDARWGADGDFAYEGKIDVKEGSTSIRRHVRDYCLFMSGRETPPHRTAAEWKAFLDACVPEEQRRMLAAILDGCQLDDVHAAA